ncbi:MAG: alpha-glucan family phosphorylase, partial [Candidatus Zixiibacteriota bacterium]
MTNPDYLFEVSWEVCNKVGGIHTVISSKARTLQKQFGDNFMLVGPGIWQDVEGNPEFEEDQSLLLAWKQKAFSEGLDFKIGRWKIPGNPIVILVNFSSFFELKDKIFAEFWEKFKLDSLTGGWDYVEPVMFGYAAGKVIESYYHFFVSSKDTIVAQFHEWMTSSGILFLKERVPQIATVFTTHATVMGRSIAGNNLPLYSGLEKLDTEALAKQFSVQAKQSLEKIAANEADVLTTVSELTNNECRKFLEIPANVITPNGFEKDLLPDDKTWLSQRIKGRKRLKAVVQAIINQQIPDDALFVNISGRYELKNKGLDLFIEALNQIKSPPRTIVAFILVPAGHAGPRMEILERIHNENLENPITSCYLTHYLFEKEADPVLQRLFQSNLNNGINQNVKVVFSPVYLNGKDGIINIPYYDLLPAFDLTVYPSYYEPWGYTPLESIAFKIPTITTTLAGFSHWVNSLHDIENKSVSIVQRDDFNDKEVVEDIKQIILGFLQKQPDEIQEIGENAKAIALKALWENLINNYYLAYNQAITKSKDRFFAYASKLAIHDFAIPVENQPDWKKVLVKSKLPEKFKSLQEIANNLWWSWHDEASELFRLASPEKWNECKQNPVHLLEILDFDDFKKLGKNKNFQDKLNYVYQEFQEYLEKRKLKKGDLIAYFSMEYGLHHSVRIYSGGLGILAGDYLKQASDDHRNFVGVGLLYRYGYFEQEISSRGEQKEIYSAQKLSHLPVVPVRDEKGDWVKIKLTFPGRTI